MSTTSTRTPPPRFSDLPTALCKSNTTSSSKAKFIFFCWSPKVSWSNYQATMHSGEAILFYVNIKQKGFIFGVQMYLQLGIILDTKQWIS
jgi:hypothetical protein